MNATEIEGHVDIPADLEALTVAQLREIVEAVDLNVPKSAPKAALVEAVEEYRARVQERIAESLGLEPEEIEGEATEETDEPVDEETREMESRALALREEPPAQVPALLPTTAEFDAMLSIAARIASTQMVPTAYRGKPDDVLAAILTGREMGLGPMQSLRDIYVVDGKPSLSANLLLARLREGGVVILESESTNERAWIRARRRDTGEIAEVEWTYEEASKITYRKKGGATGKLVEKDNWINYRPDMLWARAVGRLSRRLGPDLIGSAMPYTSEEVQDWDDAPSDSGERATGYGSDRQTGTWSGPKDWVELSERVKAQLGQDAAAWMEELAEKAYAHPSIGDVVKDPAVADDRKADMWKRLNVILRQLESEADLSFTVGSRQVIQEIIYKAFDGAVAPVGPPWALDPEEAKTMPQRDRTPPPTSGASGGVLPVEAEATTDASRGTPEAASAAQDAPGAAPDDDLRTADGDEITF